MVAAKLTWSLPQTIYMYMYEQQLILIEMISHDSLYNMRKFYFCFSSGYSKNICS